MFGNRVYIRPGLVHLAKRGQTLCDLCGNRLPNRVVGLLWTPTNYLLSYVCRNCLAVGSRGAAERARGAANRLLAKADELVAVAAELDAMPDDDWLPPADLDQKGRQFERDVVTGRRALFLGLDLAAHFVDDARGPSEN